jgi:hypothetical protein
MQNSELFRRGVVVPLDDRAEESLRCNNVNTTTQVQYLPITNDSLFEGLWKSGLFHEIYKRCGTLIDDYEEAFVETSGMPGLTAAVEAVAEKEYGTQPDVYSFLVALHKLTTHASGIERPVLFVL